MAIRQALAGVLFACACWLGAPAQSPAQQVDPEFLRMWEAAQRQRPTLLATASRIAPAGEPGQPLVLRGRLLEADGRTPVSGAVIFAYQTDREGRYDRPGGDGWRLKGWARTDLDGRFAFTTIRPGPYPGRQIAAHVHLGVDGPPGQRRTLRDVLFEGDTRLSRAELERSRRDREFGNVRPVRVVGGVQVVDILLRLPGDFVF